MPDPIAICIEDTQPSHPQDRYVRCVAVSGGTPGLSIDAAGRVLWQEQGSAACELWVSADDRLVLLRLDGAPSVGVHRAGRSVDAPCKKPVILIDQDEITVGSKRLRVHVHGVTDRVHPPAPFVTTPVGRMAVAAAAIALGVGASAGCKKSGDTARQDAAVEVRDNPPSVAAPLSDASPDGRWPAGEADASADAPVDAPLDGVLDAREAGRPVAKPPIEVRHQPPRPPPKVKDPNPLQ